MLTIDVEGVHLTASLKKDPAALDRLRPALAVARVLMVHMQARLKRGKTATPARPYAGRRKTKYTVTEAYAQKAGVGKTVFTSSHQFHRRANSTPGYVTGGLVKSFRTANVGKSIAMIAPARSSLGKSSAVVKNLDDKIAKIRADAKKQIDKRKTERAKENARKRRDAKIAKLTAEKPAQVQNRFKAAALGRELNISIVQPTTEENRAMVAAVTGIAGSVVVDFFGSTAIVSPSDGDSRLLASLRKQLKRSPNA